MRDDVVSVDYGWWRPEEDASAPHFGAMDESNANHLTSCTAEEPLIGTWRLQRDSVPYRALRRATLLARR